VKHTQKEIGLKKNSYAHYICTGGEDNARGCEGHAFLSLLR